MKRVFTPMSIGAIAVVAAVFVYAFSYPLALCIVLNYLPRDCIPYLVKFYHPANTVAMHCPPYLAILTWEVNLLPIHYSAPPPGAP